MVKVDHTMGKKTLLIDVDKCSGCDLCGVYCPDFAIFGGRYAR